MDIFRIVSLIHNIDIGFPGSMTLLDQFFSMRDIVNGVLRDLYPGDDPLYSIDCDGSFQEPFSYLPGSPYAAEFDLISL
jgi:hypothetical protein